MQFAKRPLLSCTVAATIVVGTLVIAPFATFANGAQLNKSLAKTSAVRYAHTAFSIRLEDQLLAQLRYLPVRFVPAGTTTTTTTTVPTTTTTVPATTTTTTTLAVSYTHLIDLTEGMFRHLVVTGRSRVALYFARIPAGLAIVVSMVAVGFTIVCVVCCVAAPRTLSYDGVNVPAGMSSTAFNLSLIHI